MNNTIFSEVDHYISSLLIQEDEVLSSVSQTLRDAGLPFSTVSPNQGKFLQLMALACRASKMLELGTLGGYSAIWLARALPENGKLISVEVNEAHAKVAVENIRRAGLAEKVEIRVGRAIEVMRQLKSENKGPFDLIFIDADKPPYADYFKLALELSRPGTIIMADNVIREGQVLDPEVKDDFLNGVQKFNQLLSTTTNVSSTIIQTVGVKPHDGISISIVNR